MGGCRRGVARAACSWRPRSPRWRSSPTPSASSASTRTTRRSSRTISPSGRRTTSSPRSSRSSTRCCSSSWMPRRRRRPETPPRTWPRGSASSPMLYADVYVPGGGEFFERHGLLYMTRRRARRPLRPARGAPAPAGGGLPGREPRQPDLRTPAGHRARPHRSGRAGGPHAGLRLPQPSRGGGDRGAAPAGLLDGADPGAEAAGRLVPAAPRGAAGLRLPPPAARPPGDRGRARGRARAGTHAGERGHGAHHRQRGAEQRGDDRGGARRHLRGARLPGGRGLHPLAGAALAPPGALGPPHAAREPRLDRWLRHRRGGPREPRLGLLRRADDRPRRRLRHPLRHALRGARARGARARGGSGGVVAERRRLSRALRLHHRHGLLRVRPDRLQGGGRAGPDLRDRHAGEPLLQPHRAAGVPQRLARAPGREPAGRGRSGSSGS